MDGDTLDLRCRWAGTDSENNQSVAMHGDSGIRSHAQINNLNENCYFICPFIYVKTEHSINRLAASE